MPHLQTSAGPRVYSTLGGPMLAPSRHDARTATDYESVLAALAAKPRVSRRTGPPRRVRCRRGRREGDCSLMADVSREVRLEKDLRDLRNDWQSVGGLRPPGWRSPHPTESRASTCRQRRIRRNNSDCPRLLRVMGTRWSLAHLQRFVKSSCSPRR